MSQGADDRKICGVDRRSFTRRGLQYLTLNLATRLRRYRRRLTGRSSSVRRRAQRSRKCWSALPSNGDTSLAQVPACKLEYPSIGRGTASTALFYFFLFFFDSILRACSLGYVDTWTSNSALTPKWFVTADGPHGGVGPMVVAHCFFVSRLLTTLSCAGVQHSLAITATVSPRPIYCSTLHETLVRGASLLDGLS